MKTLGRILPDPAGPCSFAGESCPDFNRDTIESEASIFALHPQRHFPPVSDPRELTTLTLTEIKRHASRLAGEHQVNFQGKSSRLLMEGLEKAVSPSMISVVI